MSRWIFQSCPCCRADVRDAESYGCGRALLNDSPDIRGDAGRICGELCEAECQRRYGVSVAIMLRADAIVALEYAASGAELTALRHTFARHSALELMQRPNGEAEVQRRAAAAMRAGLREELATARAALEADLPAGVSLSGLIREAELIDSLTLKRWSLI